MNNSHPNNNYPATPNTINNPSETINENMFTANFVPESAQNNIRSDKGNLLNLISKLFNQNLLEELSYKEFQMILSIFPQNIIDLILPLNCVHSYLNRMPYFNNPEPQQQQKNNYPTHVCGVHPNIPPENYYYSDERSPSMTATYELIPKSYDSTNIIDEDINLNQSGRSYIKASTSNVCYLSNENNFKLNNEWETPEEFSKSMKSKNTDGKKQTISMFSDFDNEMMAESSNENFIKPNQWKTTDFTYNKTNSTIEEDELSAEYIEEEIEEDIDEDIEDIATKNMNIERSRRFIEAFILMHNNPNDDLDDIEDNSEETENRNYYEFNEFNLLSKKEFVVSVELEEILNLINVGQLPRIKLSMAKKKPNFDDKNFFIFTINQNIKIKYHRGTLCFFVPLVRSESELMLIYKAGDSFSFTIKEFHSFLPFPYGDCGVTLTGSIIEPDKIIFM